MTKKRKGSKKGTAKLRKIVAKAKKIRKDHPSMKWQNAIKEAAKKV